MGGFCCLLLRVLQNLTFMRCIAADRRSRVWRHADELLQATEGEAKDVQDQQTGLAAVAATPYALAAAVPTLLLYVLYR